MMAHACLRSIALVAPIILSRLSLANAHFLVRNGDTSSGGSGESCADLLNRNTYFAVSVGIGSPPQYLDLVADTGSSSVIATSCVCADQGYCPSDDKCFRGTNRSSTFKLTKLSADPNSLGVVKMTFGSGTVASIVASDVVQVGKVKTTMKDALMLMVDRRELRIAGKFEGILGLGPPEKDEAVPPPPQEWRPKTSSQIYKNKLFLQEAGVDRFSVCFNDAGQSGALRLDVAKFANPLPAIGTVHWGLGFYGLRVGKHSAPAVLCDPSSMRQGQSTPCGAIPDSGTTLMMGPKEHIVMLFDSLCDEWARCRNARANGGPLQQMSKSHAFQTLLYHCGSWMRDEDGINEVPSIFVTVGGPGKQEVLELTAWSYITETMQEQYKVAVKHLYGVIPVQVRIPTGKAEKVCVPSFGVQEYNTQLNGPVWLFGTPLFYEFTVGYDLSGPSLGFSQQKCGMCNETQPSFLSSKRQLRQSHNQVARKLRHVSSPPRTPYMDTSLPL